MAIYGTIYRMEFRDLKDLLWRVDFKLKGAGETDTPLMLSNIGGSPVVINWDGDEDDSFSPITSSTADITYYRSSDTDPAPETFIDIEEDEWLVDISKLPDNTTPILFWRGLIKPDNNRYQWLPMPYSFTVTASDLTYSKGVNTNLNENGLFFYDYITIGESFNRTLFQSIGYDTGVLKILFNIKPDSIGGGLITNSLYIHTDAFYDFTDGPLYSYDAMEKLLSSLNARLSYSYGSFWMQRIQDMSGDIQNIITITPDDFVGTSSANMDIFHSLGNSASDTIVYLDQSQYLTVNAGLKQQIVNYELRAINQVKNFDWRDTSVFPYTNWTEGDNTGQYVRTGTGTVDDPYRLIVTSSTEDNLLLSDHIPVKSGQKIELSIKVAGFLTLTSGFVEDYTLNTLVAVILVNTAELGELYSMDSTGEWVSAPVDGAYQNFSSNPEEDPADTTIVSKPIPEVSGVNLAVQIAIWKSTIDTDPPSGSTFYTELYPVSLGVYTNRYENYEEKIVNNKNYSLIADDKDKFFLDTQEDGLSNTIFYDDAGTKRALPAKDWNGESIDETVLRGELDQRNKAGYSFDGDVLSNDLSFHHTIVLTDLNNKKMMLNRDKYDIAACKHSIYATELMEIGSGDGIYTVTPKIDE